MLSSLNLVIAMLCILPGSNTDTDTQALRRDAISGIATLDIAKFRFHVMHKCIAR